ncbi:MAG: hypothetical protein IJD75_00315, partial [Clostridia bacterium]|nr:hypothetical protein [Clostridia bacterium]
EEQRPSFCSSPFIFTAVNEDNRMNLIHKRILSLLLALLLATSFVGCNREEKNEETTGIPIQSDPAYSDALLQDAEQIIYALVVYTYRSAVMDKISETVEARLARYAHRLCEITAAKPIPEDAYRSVLALLEREGEGVIDELLALRAGEDVGYERTRTLYLDLTYAFGAEQVASMLYEVCLLIYDAKYEQAVERFETYQYPWYQEEADALAAEKQLFAQSIGKDAFSALVRCGTAMAELLVTTPEGIADSFSDAEMLEVIRHLDFSKIDITPAGWELLLSHVPSGESGSYRSRLSAAFRENGDVSRLAAVMNDAVKLLSSAKEKLTPADIAALRAGDRDALVSAVFSRFGEDDWALFASVTSISLANQAYSALAEAAYGEAYLTYVASIGAVDLSTLQASVGGEAFVQNLSNYLAGICPAIAYEVNS